MKTIVRSRDVNILIHMEKPLVKDLLELTAAMRSIKGKINMISEELQPLLPVLPEWPPTEVLFEKTDPSDPGKRLYSAFRESVQPCGFPISSLFQMEISIHERRYLHVKLPESIRLYAIH